MPSQTVATRGRGPCTPVAKVDFTICVNKLILLHTLKKYECTVVSDENFQIPGQKIFSDISGPGPSYLSLGTSQDHILSYFAHMCLGAQVQCGEARENGHFWDYFV